MKVLQWSCLFAHPPEPKGPLQVSSRELDDNTAGSKATPLKTSGVPVLIDLQQTHEQTTCLTLNVLQTQRQDMLFDRGSA